MRRGLSFLLAFALLATACSTPTSGADTVPASSTAATEAPTTPSPATTLPVPTTTSVATPDSTNATTAGPVPTPGPDDMPDGTVGFVGCSVSQNAVAGYSRILGGDRFWPANAPYGGGSIGRWVSDLDRPGSRYWTGFEENLASYPDTRVIWYSLCTIRGAPGDNVEMATLVVEEILERVPDAVIYVSGQPGYAGGHLCELAGETGPEQMAEVAQGLVDLGLARPGPTMGPLTADQTVDGCHANEAGQELMGRQLLEFFG